MMFHAVDACTKPRAETTVPHRNALLVCDRVSKHFGSLAAVDQFSLTVGQGEIVGLGGPNGAGKTTLFDVITGMSPASAGRIWFDEREITHLGADRICQLGLARTFQLNAAFDSMSVRENVEIAAYFGREQRNVPGFRIGRETKRHAEEVLAFVGLSDKSDMTVGQLPVLDRKLLMVAGAMATNPRILFLDEPVGGLNPGEIDKFMELVIRLRDAGKTIVLIEHVMRFLLALSSRVIIMHHGEIIFQGRPDKVAEDPVVVETYLGQGATRRLRSYFAKAPMRQGDGGVRA